MKRRLSEKQDDKLVYTHGGQACTVRRVYHRDGIYHASEIISATPRLNLWQRLFLSLLPHLALGEIV